MKPYFKLKTNKSVKKSKKSKKVNKIDRILKKALVLLRKNHLLAWNSQTLVRHSDGKVAYFKKFDFAKSTGNKEAILRLLPSKVKNKITKVSSKNNNSNLISKAIGALENDVEFFTPQIANKKSDRKFNILLKDKVVKVNEDKKSYCLKNCNNKAVFTSYLNIKSKTLKKQPFEGSVFETLISYTLHGDEAFKNLHKLITSLAKDSFVDKPLLFVVRSDNKATRRMFCEALLKLYSDRFKSYYTLSQLTAVNGVRHLDCNVVNYTDVGERITDGEASLLEKLATGEVISTKSGLNYKNRTVVLLSADKNNSFTEKSKALNQNCYVIDLKDEFKINWRMELLKYIEPSAILDFAINHFLNKLLPTINELSVTITEQEQARLQAQPVDPIAKTLEENYAVTGIADDIVFINDFYHNYEKLFKANHLSALKQTPLLEKVKKMPPNATEPNKYGYMPLRLASKCGTKNYFYATEKQAVKFFKGLRLKV